ncbi:MAG: type 1 glutamine amidotransferase [Pseudomonadota bacterium]
MPKILIVDSNPKALNDRNRRGGQPGLGDGYAAALTSLDAEAQCTIIAPYDGDASPALDRFDGIVFTGSAVEWSTEDPRAEPLAVIMRAAFAAAKPVLGSCNGLQLAATLLGGESGASPNGVEEGLARDLQLTQAGKDHPMMAGRQSGYAVPCIHRDEVTKLPQGTVVLATNAHSPVQAFAYEKDGVDFWGVQYHPEYTPEYMRFTLQSRGASARDAEAAVSPTPSDTERMTELRNWLDHLR